MWALYTLREVYTVFLLEKLEVSLSASSPGENTLPFHHVAGRLYLFRAGIIAPELSKGRPVKQFLPVEQVSKNPCSTISGILIHTCI